MSQDPGEVLKEVCDEIVADKSLQPVKDSAGKIIETHCNFGAERVAVAMGCHELDGINADAQYRVMDANESGRWRKVSGSEATIHALGGGLAFAAMTSEQLKEDHGHIAAIYPAGMQWSGSLAKDVPMVANVGKFDREERASEAFPVEFGEPDYFIWS